MTPTEPTTLEIKARAVLAKHASEILGPPSRYWRFAVDTRPAELEAKLATDLKGLSMRFTRKSVWWDQDFNSNDGPCYRWLVSNLGESDEISFWPQSGKLEWGPFKQEESKDSEVLEPTTVASVASVASPTLAGIYFTRNDVFLPDTTLLKATYKAKGSYTPARVNGVIHDGKIITTDEDGYETVTKTLSAAAVAATGASAINGWTFWKIKRPDDQQWVDAKKFHEQGKARKKQNQMRGRS